MSKRTVALIIVFIGLALAAIFGYLSYSRSRKPTAALKVETTPPSLVFVDNVQVGQTPVDHTFPPGEVTVKLIPNSTSSALSTYKTKVRLTNQTYTVIKRDFGDNDSKSSGEIISLLPQSGKTASLSVVTSGPDSASVVLDGQPQGFTPLAVPSLAAGDHQIIVSAPGFATRTLTAKAVIGYKLMVNVKLSADGDRLLPTPTLISITPPATPSGSLSSPTPTPRSGTPTPTFAPNLLPKPYVKISNTPVGFLRVRQKPSTGSSEIGQVKPGETYSLLSSQSGWYEIKVALPATSSGWISSQYAQKFE